MSTQIRIDDYRHDKASKGNYTITTIFYEDNRIDLDDEVVGTYETPKEMVDIIQKAQSIYVSKGDVAIELINFNIIPTIYSTDGYTTLKIDYTYKATNKKWGNVVIGGIVFRIYGRSSSEIDTIEEELRSR